MQIAGALGLLFALVLLGLAGLVVFDLQAEGEALVTGPLLSFVQSIGVIWLILAMCAVALVAIAAVMTLMRR